MMKLIVGYQLRPDERFIDCILRHAACVGEVYYAWPGIANGRSTVSGKYGFTPWETLDRQRSDLKKLSEGGMRFNLLLNGNCYGSESLSRSFYTKIGDLIDALGGEYGLDAVTTTSPVIARFVKQNFESIEVRASVNMEIGTMDGVRYLADVMDGFYVKREINRHLEQVRRFSAACHDMGKKVYMLANSGCLNHCSARQFHDNLVSHEAELMKMDNAFIFDGVCRHFLADPSKRKRILAISNWILPSELHRYDGIVDGVKLATRVTEHPEMILEAYASGRFSGNLLALTEPDFSALYHPLVLNAGRLPVDFFSNLSDCTNECDHCGYCERIFDSIAEALDNDVLFDNMI